MGHLFHSHHSKSSIRWPSFRGTATFVGTTASKLANIYYDARLKSKGLQNAKDLLADADRIITLNNGFFGTHGTPVNVIIFALGGATDGTGGADHDGCDFSTGGNIEVCAAFGQSTRCGALFEAEYSECSMNRNLCGLSTGEALSRVCAALVSHNALADFAVVPYWISTGMANWVDHTDLTDGNPVSTGCGMAFISWLISLGKTINEIAPAMVALGDAGTFAQLYGHLTQDQPQNAWGKFSEAVKSLPVVTTDFPFNTI